MRMLLTDVHVGDSVLYHGSKAKMNVRVVAETDRTLTLPLEEGNVAFLRGAGYRENVRKDNLVRLDYIEGVEIE